VTAVLPHTSSSVKVQMIRQLGAQVLLHGASLAESAEEAKTIAAQSDALLLPFNLGDITQSNATTPLALAGYGTIALEILQQLGRQDPPDAVFVPCSSGALLAGIAIVMHRISPSTKIVGVTTRPSGPLATRILPGNLRLIEMYADGVMSVDDGEIASAVCSVYGETRSLLEPTGALGLAGARQWRKCGSVAVAYVIRETWAGN